MGLMQSRYKVTEAVSVINTQYKSKHIEGVVLFIQKEDHVHIKVEIKGLSKNHLHGFHIHESGDLREGCKSCCAHYNPENTEHGSINNGHAGDLGNLKTDEHGYCKMSLSTDKFLVDDILGRSIIIHEDVDDLGLGEFEDSKTTGHSGARIACSLIGISKDCK